MIKYLSNARMGRIDKVRTKIEDFLININDEEIDNTLVNVLEEKIGLLKRVQWIFVVKNQFIRQSIIY